MFDVGSSRIQRRIIAAPGDGSETIFFRQALYIEQSGIAADRARAFAHEFHAVVIFRIVARGDGDAAIQRAVERREINFLGSAQTDIDHIDAAVAQAIGQRHLQRLAGQPDIVTDHYRTRFYHLGVGPADAVRDIFYDLFRHTAA